MTPGKIDSFVMEDEARGDCRRSKRPLCDPRNRRPPAGQRVLVYRVLCPNAPPPWITYLLEHADARLIVPHIREAVTQSWNT